MLPASNVQQWNIAFQAKECPKCSANISKVGYDMYLLFWARYIQNQKTPCKNANKKYSLENPGSPPENWELFEPK